MSSRARRRLPSGRVNASTTGTIFDPQDYFFLDTSGFGAGAYNIPLGPGSLAIAYLWRNRKWHRRISGCDDTSFDDFTLDVNGGTGDFYRHVLRYPLG